MEPIPTELFLSGHPPDIRSIAERLCDVVMRAVPDAIERVRPGWRLIGFDVPVGTRTRYFAFVAPEVEHVHLGFEYGVWMDDPHHLLRGAHLDLREGALRHLRARRPDPGRASHRVHPRRGAACGHVASRANGTRLRSTLTRPLDVAFGRLRYRYRYTAVHRRCPIWRKSQPL